MWFVVVCCVLLRCCSLFVVDLLLRIVCWLLLIVVCWSLLSAVCWLLVVVCALVVF